MAARRKRKPRVAAITEGQIYANLSAPQWRPLTVIGASAELLQRHLDQLTEAKRRQLLELIRSSAQRMRVMLDEVIDVGRANSGMESCHPELLDLGALVRASLDEMRLVDCGQHQFLFLLLDRM